MMKMMALSQELDMIIKSQKLMEELRDRSMVLIGGCLVGLVAPARVLAATAHGGALTLDLIVIELITLTVAVLAARSMTD